MAKPTASDDRPGNAGCLCGAVRFTVETPPAKVSICHCDMCRRWAGGPMMAVHPETPVRLENAGSLRWHDSSDWADRGFCEKCGTSLFYRLSETPDDLIVAAGAFDEQAAFTGLDYEIFIDEKPGFYDFKGDAPRMTGAEFFALVAGQQSDGAAGGDTT